MSVNRVIEEVKRSDIGQATARSDIGQIHQAALDTPKNIINEIGTGVTSIVGSTVKGAVKSSVGAAKDLINPSTKNPNAPETPAPPPTLDDAKKGAEPLGPKTYSKSGTIRNKGGKKGLASSTLNLSSQTLTGS